MELCSESFKIALKSIKISPKHHKNHHRTISMMFRAQCLMLVDSEQNLSLEKQKQIHKQKDFTCFISFRFTSTRRILKIYLKYRYKYKMYR